MLFVGLAVSEESTSLNLAKLICVSFVLSNLGIGIMKGLMPISLFP
jgi:hypothetical protein